MVSRSGLCFQPGFVVLAHVLDMFRDVRGVHVEPVFKRHVAVFGMVGGVGPRLFGQGLYESVGLAAEPLEEGQRIFNCVNLAVTCGGG